MFGRIAAPVFLSMAALGAACPHATVMQITEMPATVRYISLEEDDCQERQVIVGDRAHTPLEMGQIGYYRLSGGGRFTWWCGDGSNLSEEATTCPDGTTLVRATRTSARQHEDEIWWDCADENGSGSNDRLELFRNRPRAVGLIHSSTEGCSDDLVRAQLNAGEVPVQNGQSITFERSQSEVVRWDCGPTDTGDETNCHAQVLFARVTRFVGDREFRVDCFGE